MKANRSFLDTLREYTVADLVKKPGKISKSDKCLVILHCVQDDAHGRMTLMDG